MKVLFVAKGSMQDGLGHIARTAAVANEMAKHADVGVVVVGDDHAGRAMANWNLETLAVVGDDDDLARALVDRWDVAVFDALSISDDLFQRLSRGSLTISLSPIFDQLARVDLAFHRSSISDPEWPDLDPHAMRQGLEYSVIPPHCHRIETKAYVANLERDRLSIAVAMGGTDAPNKTLQILQALQAAPEPFLVWVLLGEGYVHSYEALVDAVSGTRHEVILAKTNDSMWRILAGCSLAILAGGTTTYEAAYAGLPSFNTLETPRHLFLIQELVDGGVALCLGETFEAGIGALGQAIASVNADRSRLLSMHSLSEGLIDNKGTERIVAAILELHGAAGRRDAHSR